MPQSDDTYHIESSHSNPEADDVAWLLDRVEPLKRGPNGFLEAWKGNDDPTGEELKGDYITWIAYYATKRAVESSSHFANKSMLRERLDAFVRLSSVNKQNIARQLNLIIEDSLRQRLLSWRYRLRMPGTETNDDDDDLRSQTPADEDNHPPDRTRKRQRIVENDANDNEQVTGSGAAITPALQPQHDPERTATGGTDLATMNGHTLYGASLYASSRLHPPYLAGAIRRIPHPVHQTLSAGIGMTYPNEAMAAKFGYKMAIEINANKIDYIASQLFGAHFEVDGGTRHLCLPGGTTVQPDPRITLRGCQIDAIPLMFGPETYKAVIAGPMYQDDAKQYLQHTAAVIMHVSQKATEHALIVLSLGLMEGTFIANNLYM